MIVPSEGTQGPSVIDIVRQLADTTIAATSDPTPENLQEQDLAVALARYAAENNVT